MQRVSTNSTHCIPCSWCRRVLENKMTSAFLWCITMVTPLVCCHHLSFTYLDIPESLLHSSWYSCIHFTYSLLYLLPRCSLSACSWAFLTFLCIYHHLYLYIAPLFVHLSHLPMKHWGIVSFLDLVVSYTHYVHSHCCYYYRLWALC